MIIKIEWPAPGRRRYERNYDEHSIPNRRVHTRAYVRVSTIAYPSTRDKHRPYHEQQFHALISKRFATKTFFRKDIITNAEINCFLFSCLY